LFQGPGDIFLKTYREREREGEREGQEENENSYCIKVATWNK
jgi:hypothetical protein